MSSLELFGQMPKSKAEINQYVSNIEEMFLSGEFENLLQFEKLKVFESIIKKALDSKKVKNVVLKAWEKHGQKVESEISILTKSETGVSYDYSECDDLELIELAAAAELANQKLKARQEFLKAIPKDAETYDKNGVRIFAPVKKGTPIIKCEIK